MALERINPSDIYQPYKNFYTQVIRATGTTQVHVAGIIALNKQGELIGEGDLQAQVRAITENTGHALAAAGAKPADVVRITIYTLDVDRYRAEGHQEVLKFFDGDLPVSTLIGVTRLADPRYLVEIEMTAIID
jgi:enamine deaminase RidA (YjgF/YER057c/UK114 family)